MFAWLKAKTLVPINTSGAARARRAFVQSTLPVISPRRSRRILRREQLFSVVRESLIRGGVLSTSYEFKVLTLDVNGDSFLVLIDLALPAELMSDEYLLEIERWIQSSAESRHSMVVRSVYWRRKAASDQRGTALKSAVAVQIRRDPSASTATALHARTQPVAREEVNAFQRALQSTEPQARQDRPGDEALLPVPESHSDFSALSETQYGKL
ncbi:MAG: hypothetical protein Q8K21_19770 [Hydrogenophaga sp.]|uniref:hypothetical protein n=1 Tax=Hydrogenophaga sp. TaxID=1904254 RepID=UPI00272F2F42|nr:hypothetical protein [Hydrogenophaga sp.]MDP2166420.1 hypothetical protein [Hydrogenophaga sp.]